jgi:Mlc titration factor MtfA (ptsG expression regulator)
LFIFSPFPSALQNVMRGGMNGEPLQPERSDLEQRQWEHKLTSRYNFKKQWHVFNEVCDSVFDFVV